MFRFTIRDVLWLTVVVALGIAWWINRQDNAAMRERSAELERNNADLKTAVARAGWNLYRDKTGPFLGVPADAPEPNLSK